jgi:hypothetical protein
MARDRLVLSAGSADYGGGALPGAQLVKLDPSGNYLSARSITGTNVAHVETGSGNAIYLSGSAMDAVDFGGGPLLPAGNQDVVVVKLDAAGQQVHALRAPEASPHFSRDPPERTREIGNGNGNGNGNDNGDGDGDGDGQKRGELL